MELDPATTAPVVNRIKRAQGQLAGVLRMLEEGRASLAASYTAVLTEIMKVAE